MALPTNPDEYQKLSPDEKEKVSKELDKQYGFHSNTAPHRYQFYDTLVTHNRLEADKKSASPSNGEMWDQ